MHENLLKFINAGDILTQVAPAEGRGGERRI